MPARPSAPHRSRRPRCVFIRLHEAELAELADAAHPQPVATWARDVLVAVARRSTLGSQPLRTVA